ncbi:hypothetical protein E2K93_07240 [Thalassotalea sp. HSM 43]|uniref:hypothetical protein n=1 Tax=Thalassotalea sp. HSM 43 TaxID=2552945 RepID=UPI00108150F3|nr:hypothetical protein [Thalassotalea sp. HSM 43]QBY04192.1 hypothetical protein E2K93_07240 [Thalassotalea sp. HSM 43]
MLSTLIILHITAGAIALIFGFMTIATTKGNARHKRYGKVYVVAMLLLGSTGTIVAAIREIPLSMLNGAVLCYFVLSSISAIRNAEYKISVFDKWLTVFSWVLVAAFAWYALQVTQTESGQLGGFGIAEYIVFGTVMLFAGIADIRYLLKSGLSTIQKLVRHLWRMFFPLFMATAAFFLGQAKLFPEVLKSIEILAIPVVFVILSMIYWLLMVAMRKSAFR